jgi:hypothetical protein
MMSTRGDFVAGSVAAGIDVSGQSVPNGGGGRAVTPASPASFGVVPPSIDTLGALPASAEVSTRGPEVVALLQPSARDATASDDRNVKEGIGFR